MICAPFAPFATPFCRIAWMDSMMKKLVCSMLFSLLFALPAAAQDAPPTGIGYIPGMPLPEKSAVPAPAPAPAGARQGNGSSSGQQDGRIAKVTVSKGSFGNGADAAPAEPEPVVVAAPIVPAEYHGVTPPKRLKPQNESTFAKTSANQLSWIGFMPEEKTHRIFLQTTSPTTYERIATPSNRVEIRLANTKLAVANNKRELDMKYFQSPFARAYAKAEGKNVRVVVELKSAVDTNIVVQDNVISITAPASAVAAAK